ncbi:Rieske 2Fe-2S domain-containing protein [Govanella unica]|uniref:Rieske 2Fe-2S domain-containing protein n=1 Tax=Govanella unica TaxID=2975056 RepID=A0A9X3Z6G9_9PROT|nr:Rieske 2Fe-2S domain-containing protein [Govania unica]MDA5192919.1 Rieske 2Fe-2S domain-containing protein [Govania unica]
MLINNWYVAAYSSEVVKDKPLGVKILGCDFVLFRNENNEAVCLSDVCCHRGASLSRGKIVDDGCAVACPFHGWQFESGGRCIKIPSMGDVKVPKRARVDSYPTFERYDWVWVFLGDLPEDKRPPVPDLLPEYYQTDEWRSTHLLTEVPVNWSKMEENSLDTAHLTFVHSVFGSREDATATIVPIEKRPYGGYVYRERTAPKASQKSGVLGQLLSQERTKTTVSLEYSVVGICHRIHPQFRPGMAQIAFSSTTPVDNYTSRLFSIQARNYAIEPEHDQERLDGRKNAIAEDRAVVSHVRPKVGPTPLTDEFLVEADGMEVAFRKSVFQLIDKGWEIDTKKVAEDYDRKVYVIPSPERRKDPKNWVHETIPTTRPRADDDDFTLS